MKDFKLIFATLILAMAFSISSSRVFASSFDENPEDYDNCDSNGFFGDLFCSSDDPPEEKKPIKKPPPKRARYKPVLDVSLSETFLNNVTQKYIAPGNFLTELYLGFDTKKNGLVVRGKVKLSKEIMAGYGLPSKVGQIGFQSAIKLRITNKGYLAITFPEELTSIWPGSINSPTGADKITIPTGFLEVAIARTRVYLSTLSGDYSSYERRKAVIVNSLAEERKKRETLKGNDALFSDLRIDGLKMEVDLLAWRIKSAKLKVKVDSKIVKFLSDSEYKSELNLNARRNTLLINPSLHNMFPFLSEVRIGDITFPKTKGTRYMSMTLSALIRE